LKPEKIKVLYIDDEVNNLNSFKAAFRFDYNIFIAENTNIAFDLLKQHPEISIIISDQRMPDKTGVEFLEEVRSIYPAPVRMLLTGYADIEAVIGAINRGNIFRYIQKPWNEADVKSAIDEGYKFYITNSMLENKNIELQKAYNELDKFAYSVTHDLRGPILSAIGVINVAKNVEDITEMKSIMEMIEKAMHKLNDFIENTHDYYNLKRGELKITDINFQDIINDIKDIYEINCRVNAINFITKVEQVETFRSDEMSIRIILNNLVSNAFKFQKKAGTDKMVDLHINVNRGSAVISIKDNGIGIPENDLNYIFDMFYRATTEEYGSGFGLYNVKDALMKINGKIEVQSTPNEGTTFKMIVPSK